MGPRVRSGSPGRARVEWMWRVCPRLPGGPGLDHDGQLRIGGVSLLQSGSLLVIRDTGASLTRAGADAIRMNELDAGGLSGRVVFPPGEGIGRTRPGAGSRPRRGRFRPPDPPVALLLRQSLAAIPTAAQRFLGTSTPSPVGCQKSVVAVTSRYRLTKDYDAPLLIVLTGGGLVWSGRSSTSRCAASLSWCCSASARRRPKRSRSWCYATSSRCSPATIHGPACSLPTGHCLRR